MAKRIAHLSIGNMDAKNAVEQNQSQPGSRHVAKAPLPLSRKPEVRQQHAHRQGEHQKLMTKERSVHFEFWAKLATGTDPGTTVAATMRSTGDLILSVNNRGKNPNA